MKPMHREARTTHVPADEEQAQTKSVANRITKMFGYQQAAFLWDAPVSGFEDVYIPSLHFIFRKGGDEHHVRIVGADHYLKRLNNDELTTLVARELIDMLVREGKA